MFPVSGNWWHPAKRQAGMQRSNYRLNSSLVCSLTLNSQACSLQFLPVSDQYVTVMSRQVRSVSVCISSPVASCGQTCHIKKVRNRRGAHFVYKINISVLAQVVEHRVSGSISITIVLWLHNIAGRCACTDKASWPAKLAVVERGHGRLRLCLPEQEGASSVLTRLVCDRVIKFLLNETVHCAFTQEKTQSPNTWTKLLTRAEDSQQKLCHLFKLPACQSQTDDFVEDLVWVAQRTKE